MIFIKILMRQDLAYSNSNDNENKYYMQNPFYLQNLQL